MADSPIDDGKARELLSQARERIEKSLADLKHVRASEVDEVKQDANLEDAGGQIEEEEVDDALVRKLRYELEAVERAEARVEDGKYGLSVESGDPLPSERLQAVPWAERTIEEQERYERSHGRPY